MNNDTHTASLATDGRKEMLVLDFDGTLTRADTLIALFRHARGTAFTLLTLALYAPLLVLMKLRLYPNWKAKQRVFARFFKGMEADGFDRLCQSFAQSHARLMRPGGIACVRKALRRGARVVVVSASAENWVRCFVQTYLSVDGNEQIEVLGTRLEMAHGRLTGRFSTPNCYGPEKVRRIQAVLPCRDVWHVKAYGDSRGDREMLAWADEAHYKPFRNA